MTIEVFSGTPEECQDELQRRIEAANQAALAWQRQLAYGDFFLRAVYADDAPLFIYGELIDPVASADPEEREYVQQSYSQPHMDGFRFSRCYSPMCEHGELGDVHISSISLPLTQAQFESAKANDWPQNLPFVANLILAFKTHPLTRAAVMATYGKQPKA